MSDLEVKNQEKNGSTGITRRQFIRNLGLSSVGAATMTSGVLSRLHGAPFLPAEKVYGPDAVDIVLNVNGKKLTTSVEPRMTLADVLRDHFNLTGTKVGCDRGACGACTVIMDGKNVNSCMTLALDAVGAKLETIEGLSAADGTLHAIQTAFIEHDALQCGFCTSGMLMSCKHLLDHNQTPTLEEVQHATSGNLCRCGTYVHVFEATMTANKA